MGYRNLLLKEKIAERIIENNFDAQDFFYNQKRFQHFFSLFSLNTVQKIFDSILIFPNFQDQKLVEAITQRFNNELVFDPELNLMCYTLRDPVSAGTFPTAVEKKPRGKAQRMEIKSRCFDACLVIDGSLSYKFNDGTRAIISIHDEDVLRTVHIYSSDI